jgi:hypothetical protein
MIPLRFSIVQHTYHRAFGNQNCHGVAASGTILAAEFRQGFNHTRANRSLLELPGVEGWLAVSDHPNIWHSRFNGATPEALLRGRERIHFDYFWNSFAADENRSLPPADRLACASSQSMPTPHGSCACRCRHLPGKAAWTGAR